MPHGEKIDGPLHLCPHKANRVGWFAEAVETRGFAGTPGPPTTGA